MKLILVLILIPVLAQAAAQSASSTASTAIVPSAMTDIQLLQKATSTHIQLMAYEKEIYDNAEEAVFVSPQEVVKHVAQILPAVPVDVIKIICGYGRIRKNVLPDFMRLSTYAVPRRLLMDIGNARKASIAFEGEIKRRWTVPYQVSSLYCSKCEAPVHDIIGWIDVGVRHQKTCSEYREIVYPNLPDDTRQYRDEIASFLYYNAGSERPGIGRSDAIRGIRYRITISRGRQPFIREKLAELRKAKASAASTASMASTASANS